MTADQALPRGWVTAKVGYLVTLVNGFAFKPSQWHETGLPIIRIQNLNDSAAKLNLTQDILPDRFRVKHHDLLFAWSGTPGTSFGAHVWSGGDAWLNQHIFRVDFDEASLNKKYLRLAINQNLSRYVAAAHGGAGLAHITKGEFEGSLLLLAPRAEQDRIVEAVEEQLTRLDAAVEGLRKVQRQLRRYRAAVLKAACEGIVNGQLSLDNFKFLPTEHSEFPELLLDPGDALFNRTNSAELVGKTAIYHGSPHPCSFASYLIRVRPVSLFRSELLAYFVNSARGREWIASVVSQQVGQANVNGSKLRALSTWAEERLDSSVW